MKIRTAALLTLPLLLAGAAGWAVTAQSQEESAAQRPELQQVGDWIVSCSAGTAERKRCKMIQQLSSAKLKRVVVSWLIGRDDKGKFAMSLQTPTGVLLQNGARLSVDGKTNFDIPFRACTPQLCEAVLPLTEDLVANLSKGEAATLTITGLDGKEITYNLSLKGFTAAYKVFRQG